MAKQIDLNFGKYDPEIYKASMDRIEAAAQVIRDDARKILASQLKGKWKEHGPYKSYYRKHLTTRHGKGGPPERIMSEGASWTARQKAAMVKTIRVVRYNDPASKNVWIMAGHFNVWWAIQLEFGRGLWRGGAKPFMRPAMAMAENRIKGILEGGAAYGKRDEQIADRVTFISGI